MRHGVISLLSLSAFACAQPASAPPPAFAAPPPGSGAPGSEPQGGLPAPAPSQEWSACAASTDCVLVSTRAGACCDFGEQRAVNARYQSDAQSAWGPSAEALRQAAYRDSICTEDCAAPERRVAACRSNQCVVATEGQAPDGVTEAPAGGHLDRGPDGSCVWWPSHCDNAPCTVATTRVRCAVPFVKR